jgi:hypothetical protein
MGVCWRYYTYPPNTIFHVARGDWIASHVPPKEREKREKEREEKRKKDI